MGNFKNAANTSGANPSGTKASHDPTSGSHVSGPTSVQHGSGPGSSAGSGTQKGTPSTGGKASASDGTPS